MPLFSPINPFHTTQSAIVPRASPLPPVAIQSRSYSITQKKRKKTTYLHQDLISLGIHLGHDRKFESIAARPYILGYRHDFAVFDVRHTMWSLKRAMNFLRQASFRGCKSLFFHSNLYKFDMPYRVFFIHLAQKEKQLFIDSKWKNGAFTNFHTSCHSLFKQVSRDYVKSRSTRRVSMLEMFVRILHFTQSQYLDLVGWKAHMTKMRKFWRFFCFFKTYQYLNAIPDVCVLINPKNQYVILQEMKRFKIPIVSMVDSNSYFSGISYPVWGNDDSPLVTLFFFQLYMNAYKLGRMDKYRLVMEKAPKSQFQINEKQIAFQLPPNRSDRRRRERLHDPEFDRVRLH